ncbi:acyltransferase [Betaproteobacteria bacterium]|nr:acyltransferase [Betaproteobacteria bacterium]GHT99448.1 acyltransferase [Betaproteobacteria bacterium]GHU24270.1 acyltransferase [Betaproteobacteria bacterium]
MSNDYKLSYRPDIEGLRAIAILLVMAAHVKLPGFQGGFVGVDVFFVLSGYLITALLVLEMESTGTVGMWGFYARRLRRLAPGLLTVIIVSCLLAYALLSPSQQLEQVGATASATVWLSNFFYAFKQIDYFGAGAEESLFLHTWSLGVEEQFYLVWPWLLLVALWLAKKQGGQVPQWKQMMWLVFVVSLSLCLYLMSLHPASAFYMMPARAWQFSLGALTWLYLREKSGTQPVAFNKTFIGLCAWLGLAVIVLAALWYGPNVPYPGIRALLPSLGAALLLAAGSHHSGTKGVMSLLSCRPMQALGHISYSWYLWHWPILVLGAAVYVNTSLTLRLALALLALVLAWISYRCVELPIRHRDTLLRRPRLIVASAVTILIASGLCSLRWLDLIDTKISSPEHGTIMGANWGLSLSYSSDCDTWYSSAEVTVCMFGDKDAPHSAVLMGDSVGAQWFPALKQRFTQPGWKLSVITKSACPMIDKPIFYARIGRDYTECTIWRERAIKMLQTNHTDYIILGSAYDYTVTPHEWTEGTQKILQSLSPHAENIALIRSTPLLSFNALNCLDSETHLTRLLTGGGRCRSPAANANELAVYTALQSAAASFNNVRLLDMNDVICPDGECNAKQDGYITFRDNRHLTAHFVSHLGEEFIRRLEPPDQAK